MMSTAVRTIVLALGALSMACAQGGSSDPSDANNGSGADAKPIDAPNPGNDAPILPADAAIDSPPADAMVDALPPGSNLFCTTSAMCTVAGECCFTFFGASSTGACVAGTEVPIFGCTPD